ncbi:uncharacterized protein G2W53_027231 [Senna tora]|uniref:Uncharacterized protein n=1 Tax=Senna tora TaxID=362788 RepID=A0A834TIJ8_9FABA|nr:uncharacterized protein G2W53_027231 [Senna tora]
MEQSWNQWEQSRSHWNKEKHDFGVEKQKDGAIAPSSGAIAPHLIQIAAKAQRWRYSASAIQRHYSAMTEGQKRKLGKFAFSEKEI